MLTYYWKYELLDKIHGLVVFVFCLQWRSNPQATPTFGISSLHTGHWVSHAVSFLQNLLALDCHLILVQHRIICLHPTNG